ncbi:MAG: F0F1 ATP synthase subunit B [Desulfobia sp.]
MNSTGKKKIVSVLLASGALVAIAALSWASADAGNAHGDGHELVSVPLLKDLLLRVINFALLVAILVKFGKKPVMGALHGRTQKIREEFEDLEAKRAEAEKEYKEYEARLASVDDELKDMVEKAVAQGQEAKERIMSEAEEAAENIKRQAEMAVQTEITEARRRLKNEIANQAAEMAEEIIRKNLKSADQEKLVRDSLDKAQSLAAK